MSGPGEVTRPAAESGQPAGPGRPAGSGRSTGRVQPDAADQGSGVGALVGDQIIRVLIADDHPVVREGLRAMLAAEPGIEVAGQASSGTEAVALAGAGAFDVILMDLRMPGLDGVAAIERILADDPGARVVVVTTYETDQDILRAVEAGAVGYLLKDSPRADLIGAVRAASRGETALAPAVAARLFTAVRRPPRDVLSPRELEILRLVARGQTNGEIGRGLFISEATVKTYLIRAFAKLGVSDRTAAVTTAIERGELEQPGTS